MVRKVYVQLPNKTFVPYQTKHAYTHAVILKQQDEIHGTYWGVVSHHKTLKAAQARYQQSLRHGAEAQIVPVVESLPWDGVEARFTKLAGMVAEIVRKLEGDMTDARADMGLPHQQRSWIKDGTGAVYELAWIDNYWQIVR